MALINKLLFGLFLCSVSILYAQKGISYQGVVLYPSVELPGIDSKVTPYSEKDVCFRFSIYDNINVLEYSETHSTTTDYYGQVNLIIGRGDNPSIAGRLEVLKWDGTVKFLKVELDYSASCSSWEEVAYDELNYVPFAFYALNSSGSGNDNQNLTGATLSGTVLQIDIEGGSPASVDLVSLQDGTGTDNQNLNLTGNTLSISNGSTTVDLSPYLDNSDSQDVVVDLTSDILTIDLTGDPDITNDTNINLAPYLDNTDNQNLNLTGNTLSISNGSTTVDLSPYLDDTDNQNLTAGPNSGEVSITGGNSVTLNVNDADSDTTNEIQDLSLNTKILSITNNLTATPINLTEVLDLADAADVTINAPADNEVLAFEGGLWVNKPLKDLQRVDLASNYPAAPEGNQLIVGLPSSPNSSNLRFVNIDEVDILIIDNSSDNSFITLEDLDVSRNGKILKIVESDNQNPKIKTVLDIFYNLSNPNDDNYLFIDIQEIILGGVGGSANRREIKYESVELLWYNGIWTPMR